MLRIRDLAQRVADTDVPVLVLGETGVGKEVLAEYIHAISNRRSQPFIKVNCAAVPADLLESELFGYERGAFTGALRDKPGKFELAAGGTLLLDEIGEMSPVLQAKLLHVLQDGECYRLGGTKPVRTEARVLASTNRCLEEAVGKGTFRQDLFFRLNVVRLEIPPLRSRSADIPPLIEHFLEKYSARYNRSVDPVPRELMDAFHRYAWPGNVRQLENAIRRYVILPEVELALAELARTGSSLVDGGDPAATSLREKSALAAEMAERQLVLRTLEEVNWNRKAAAKRLDICYKSLLNKLRRWQIPGRTAAVSAKETVMPGGTSDPRE
jgi:two-component system response regulator AtoC